MENDPQTLKKSYDLAAKLEKELSALPGSSPLDALYHTALSIVWGFRDLDLNSAAVFVNTPMTEYQLTLLQIAVIEGNSDVIVKLLDLGADINAQDFRGWTSLHHAALSGSQGILRLLLERRANPNLKNVFESTYDDIIRLKQHNEWPLDDLVPVYYAENGCSEHQITAEEYLRVTGCHYIHENIFTSLRLLQIWKEGPQHVLLPGLCDIFHQKHQQFLQRGPKLLLAPVKFDSSGNPLAASPGLGIFARESYQPMDIIGEYLGLYQVQYENPSPYFVREGPESIKYGNEISRMNDGFPNATMIRLPKYRGVPYRRFLVALDRIEPGEQIVWNYGYGKMKLEPHIELRPKETREFIKTHDVESLLNSLEMTKQQEDIHFNYYPEVEKLRYLLATPSVLFNLILEGAVPPEQGRLLAETSIRLGIIPKELKLWLDEVVQIAEKGHALFERLRLVNQKVSDDFIQCITSLPAVLNFVNTLRILIVPFEAMSFELESLQLNFNLSVSKEATVSELWKKWKDSIEVQMLSSANASQGHGHG